MKALVFSACLSVVSMVIVVTGFVREDIERYSIGLTLALLASVISRIWKE